MYTINIVFYIQFYLTILFTIDKEEICLTKKERKEYLKKRENWQAFSNLLARAISDLNRSTKFDETCEVLDNFIYLGRQLFKGQDEKVCEIIDRLEDFVEDARRQMYELDNKAKPLIHKTIDLYNSNYGGDLTFDNNDNVEQWFNRTFPLIALYVNKKIKEGDKYD